MTPDHCVCDNPAVSVFEDFATPAEANALIACAETKLARALVSHDASGRESPGRTGNNCWIPHDASSAILALCKRISALVDLPLEHAESLQVVHYGPGHSYAPHYDAWDATTARGQRCMARGGQRLLTCLVYLNNVDAGGGTGFPKLDVEIVAKRGRLLVFDNCYADSSVRHPDTLHCGLPVLAGEKWVCNLWFRAHMYQRGNARPAHAPTYSRRI